MKIGVDIRSLMDVNYSGVSEYAANLLSALLRADRTGRYRLFYNSYHGQAERLESWNRANAEVIGTHWPNKIFNYLLQSVCNRPRIDRVLGGPDIFWSPHFNFTALSAGQKRILTVHDLSFLRYPEFFSARKNFWHRALRVKKILRQADRIIAVSENTKNDIIELAGIAPEKIDVVYSGNNIRKREVGAAEINDFLGRYGLGVNPAALGRLILYLGNIEPRKNIAGLIEAFNLLKTEEEKRGHSDLKLILAGADGWKNRAIYRAWKSSKFRNDIKLLGYISKKDKEVLFSISSVFVYPSYYEGFGFPPLEAMAYGLPVVSSNVSSLPEVVADAALMIDPAKAAEISGAVQKILNDPALRDRLIEKGYRRSESFNWDKTAERYLEIFQAVYESKNEPKK